MNKAKLLKSFLTVVFLMLATLGMMTDANALPAYQEANGIAPATDFTKCTTCHAGGVTNATTGRAGLSAFCGARSYNPNTFVCNPPPVACTGNNFSASGNAPCTPCPTGGVVNATHTACPVPPPVACASPKEMINGVCVKPLYNSGSVGQRGTDAAKTDVYDVECGTRTQSLWASVMDLQPVLAPTISIQLTKGTYSTGKEDDTNDGDANYSDWVKATPPKGQGHYLMSVNKSRVPGVKGSEAYKVRFACLDANGKRTETEAEIKQNQ